MLPADAASEALEVEDPVPRLPHQVQGGDAQPAPTTLRTKSPAMKKVIEYIVYKIKSAMQYVCLTSVVSLYEVNCV